MKKILSLILALMLTTIVLPVFASPLSQQKEETLMQGVTLTHIQRLEENGWQDIYVLQADLKEPHLQFEVLRHPEGKSHLENTLEMAAKADAVAAINADFFAAKRGESGRGSAVGLEITDGVMHTSPAAYENMNVLYQLKKDSTLYFNHFNYAITLTAPDGATDQVSVINKYDDITGICMYTTDWGDVSIGSDYDLMEIVVEDGIVVQKLRNAGPVEIPENGYVLVANLTMNTFLDDHLNVGDTIQLDISTTPDFEKIETAVGGGGMILLEGKVPNTFSHTISGTHPRSAVGVDKSGTVITLVAVDGRRSEAAGMTQTQLGYLMAELGCYYAMNLDGGGSTLLAVKTEDGHKVANTPSDNYKRPVTNSIAILADTMPSLFSGVRLETKTETLFLEDTCMLSLKSLDQYKQVVNTLPANQADWQIIKGSGKVINGVFYPELPGPVTISASFGGFSDQVTLQVQEQIENYQDPAQRSSDITAKNGFRFTVSGNTRKQEKLFDLFLMNGMINAVKAESNLNFFVGEKVDAELLLPLGSSLHTANSYQTVTKHNSTMITLKSKSALSLFNADKTQWNRLVQDVKQAKNNLFIFASDVEISPLEIEKSFFSKILEEATSQGKNVFVFTGGKDSRTHLKNGVRYLTTPGIKDDVGLMSPSLHAGTVTYYVVTVNDDQVTYELKSILK